MRKAENHNFCFHLSLSFGLTLCWLRQFLCVGLPTVPIAYCRLTPEPPLAVQTSIDKPTNRGGKPNLGTLNVPSFGIPRARKLETLNVSTFRPGSRQFERQNLKSFEFQRVAKIPTFEKVGISSISLGFAYCPPETENTINGFAASGGLGICSLFLERLKRRSKNRP